MRFFILQPVVRSMRKNAKPQLLVPLPGEMDPPEPPQETLNILPESPVSRVSSERQRDVPATGEMPTSERGKCMSTKSLSDLKED